MTCLNAKWIDVYICSFFDGHSRFSGSQTRRTAVVGSQLLARVRAPAVAGWGLLFSTKRRLRFVVPKRSHGHGGFISAAEWRSDNS